MEAGMVGRRAKPTHLHLVNGNPSKKTINKREPKPETGVPARPAKLAKYASAAWDRLSKILDDMGVLTVADGIALERLCQCYAEVLACEAKIRVQGSTYEAVSVTGERVIKANPAVAQLRAADAHLRQYLVEFGLTPSARARLSVEGEIGSGKNKDKGKGSSDPLGKYAGSKAAPNSEDD